MHLWLGLVQLPPLSPQATNNLTMAFLWNGLPFLLTGWWNCWTNQYTTEQCFPDCEWGPINESWAHFWWAVKSIWNIKKKRKTTLWAPLLSVLEWTWMVPCSGMKQSCVSSQLSKHWWRVLTIFGRWDEKGWKSLESTSYPPLKYTFTKEIRPTDISLKQRLPLIVS